MSKVLYSATISMDGYLAGPGGDMSWLRPFLGPNPTVEALQKQIGALLVGANTPPSAPIPNTTFVSDVRSGLEAARAAVGEGYVNVLGADVARQCMEMGE